MKSLYYYVFIVSGIFASYSHGSRIKLYALCTPSHEALARDWFLPSIQDPFEVITQVETQDCVDGYYQNEGWKKTTGKKVDLIIRAIEENMGEFFVFSDVDIQFFEPIEPIITPLMKDYDFLVQKNHPDGIVCSGFFVCRANQKTLQLWQDVREYMRTHEKVSDQGALNICLRRKKHRKIAWMRLPDEFFSAGTCAGVRWNPDKPLYVPERVVLHHANWTEGIENKIAQLRYVKSRVTFRKILHNPRKIR